jgi:hypothetical protein
MTEKLPGPDDPLTPQERAVFGHDAKRHPVVTTMIVEQSMGRGAHDADAAAWQYVENLQRTDPELAAMWRRKLSIALKK